MVVYSIVGKRKEGIYSQTTVIIIITGPTGRPSVFASAHVGDRGKGHVMRLQGLISA